MNPAPRKIQIAVCLCTYRRESVVQTLQSIDAQNLDQDWQVSVLVADNDDTPSGRKRVIAAAENMQLPVTYLHAPAGNISLARNACLDHCQDQDWVAFLDDDETAAPDWLSRLLHTGLEKKADVVLGPVSAVYSDDAPRWMRQGRFHDTFAERHNGEIQTGYTCNVLMRFSNPSIRALRFDLAFGRSGGEDTVYFSSLYKAGARFEYAADALLSEPVPAHRASLRWLISRHFRHGQTHAALLNREIVSRVQRASHILKAGTKVAASSVGAMLHLPRAIQVRKWILRAAMHAGVVSRLMGFRAVVHYGEKD